MPHGIGELILEDERDDSFIKSIRSHKGGVTKPLKTQAHEKIWVDIQKPSSTKLSTLLYTLLLTLASRQSRLCPQLLGRVGHPQRETQKVWLVMENYGAFHRYLVETLHHILQ